MYTTTTETVKERLHVLIDQLSQEQVMRLLQLLETFMGQQQVAPTNGTAQNPSPADNSLLNDPALLKVIDNLADSPNWDEFLEDLHEVDQENNQRGL